MDTNTIIICKTYCLNLMQYFICFNIFIDYNLCLCVYIRNSFECKQLLGSHDYNHPHGYVQISSQYTMPLQQRK